ncbi:MAG: helix-turn-helix domain-containing protein [Hydrococcus sp. Prado102]|jgi:transcriptional regulator with XRE-family HTH domain|nr:helix-turn-helix domain-containing protein [Hydrococcus sp. Prado102]
MTAITTPNPLQIRTQLGLSQEHMARVLHVSAKTLWRWENTKTTLNPEAIRHLTKLKKIAEIAQKVYTNEGIEAFLTTPMDVFEGRTAYDMMSIGAEDRVIAALAADYEGLGY